MNIEKFIKENRAQLNDKNPPPIMWKHIQSRIRDDSAKVPMYRLNGLWKAGLAASFVLCMGVMVGISYSNYMIEKRLEMLLPDLKTSEIYYDNLIQVKANYLSTLNVESQAYTELEELDKMYQEIKRELLNNPNQNPEILYNAMLQNYRIRVHLIETLIDKHKQTENIFDINDKISI